jgi:trimethylamine:corrinoid methyltransferase-like protein
MAERVRARVVDILEHHNPLLIAAEVETRLEELVAKAEKRHV